jgi:NAD-dependent histone deacetylase SIR2
MICECGEYVKPDIVFFGEQLPASFFAAPKLIDECDLAIIIGTSLKVMPFAYLAQLIPQKAPVLLINREDVLESR